jgi:hemin uptake protein HemP
MTDRPLPSKWNSSNPATSSERQRGDKGSPPRFKVSELLGGSMEAILEHGGEEYRLRITSNRKLILTK